MTQIYFDYNATTPIDPAVLEVMLPYLREHFGNPSSTHAYGQNAQDAVQRARQQVAELPEYRKTGRTRSLTPEEVTRISRL